MKLKGIELNGIYKVDFCEEWFKVFDDKGNMIYYENIYNDWSKFEYDERGNRVYYEAMNGFWEKREFDEKGNTVYYDSNVKFTDTTYGVSTVVSK